MTDSMDHERDFLEAVKRGEVHVVAELLRSRPELIRAADEYDKTGLHWAAETDQAETAQLLLDAGADIEALTSWGATPLDWAAAMGSARVGDLLLARGASGLDVNRCGRTRKARHGEKYHCIGRRSLRSPATRCSRVFGRSLAG